MQLSAVIITHNEEKRLRDCLESVKFADEIVVVDSFSTDRTADVAAKFSARFLQHPFKNFSAQKNYAVSQAKGDWILIIDADERATPALQSEIKETVRKQADRCYRIKRRSFFFGRPLSYSGTQGDAPIRLFPKNSAHYEQAVHEEIITKLPVEMLRSELLHFTTETMEQYKNKMETYIGLETETMAAKNRPVSVFDVLLRPPARFLHRYFVQLGILDGWTGFQFAALSAYYDYKKWTSYAKKKRHSAL